jgi:hypothetical protein
MPSRSLRCFRDGAGWVLAIASFHQLQKIVDCVSSQGLFGGVCVADQTYLSDLVVGPGGNVTYAGVTSVAGITLSITMCTCIGHVPSSFPGQTFQHSFPKLQGMCTYGHVLSTSVCVVIVMCGCTIIGGPCTCGQLWAVVWGRVHSLCYCGTSRG